MLILSRKLNESIVIDGRITVKIMRLDGDVVKLGIAAPADVPVHRQEVYEEIRKSNQEAMARATETVPRLSPEAVAPPDHAPASRSQNPRHLKLNHS
jgi:carbon storage regulator